MADSGGTVRSEQAAAARRRARQLFSAAQVHAAISAMADQATAALADRNPVVLAMMQGGVFTAVELCRHFAFPYEFDYLHASRYRNRLSGGELQWIVPPAKTLAGRSVLLVDDVLDHGDTLRAAHDALHAAGVAELRTAVLVVKRVAVPRRPAVDYVGLRAGDVYLFGCGMDYRGYWRGLPALYAVESVNE